MAAAAALVGLGLAAAVATVGHDGGRRLAVGGEQSTTTRATTAAPDTSTPATADTTAPEPTATTTTGPATTVATTTTTSPTGGRATISVVGEATAARLTSIDIWLFQPGRIGELTVDFGDGSSLDGMYFYPGFKPCSTGEFNLPVKHAYRVPGTYTISVRFGPCDPPSTKAPTTASAPVTVGPPPDGRLPSNGPQEPMAEVFIRGGRPEETGTVNVAVSGLDWDGYVHVFRIDWGDGSPPTEVVQPLADCHDTPTSYPDYRKQPHPVAEVAHRYGAPGTWRITATVETTGCDGGSVQTAEDTKEVTVP